MVEVYFFGKFRIQVDDRVLDHIESAKALELLSYLLLKNDRRHGREKLASLFWGNYSTTAHSRKYLRNALWQLQKSVDEVLALDNLLDVSTDSITINPDCELWLDVEVVEQAYEAAKDTPPEQISDEKKQLLEEGAGVYRGVFLDGWFHEWCLAERERLHQMMFIVLDNLMALSEYTREYETGINYGQRILSFDRAREVTHRRLMRLLYLSGDRTGALRQFDLCRALLSDELDVEPSDQTVALAEAIREDRTLHDR